MTSPDAPSELLRKLAFAGDEGGRASSPAFAFTLDFDSGLRFPDLPYESDAVSSHYTAAARPAVRTVVDDAERVVAGSVPRAHAFIAEQVDRVMLRRSGAVGGATSSSNRLQVGTCVLTNVDAADDPVLVCVEALVHEGVHQYLYRIERECGDFCDLDATRRFRSPWSGNRIPLHSLVHASFVYYGLLGLWSEFGRRGQAPARAAFARDRVARSLFGYTFVRQLFEAPTFPRDRVRRPILDAIVEIARVADAIEVAPQADHTFAESLHAASGGGWLTDVRSTLARLA